MDVGMVFAMVFTIILIVLILFFAVPVIQDMFCLGTTAEITQSITDLRTLSDAIYNSGEGSSDVYDFELPQGVTLCILNPDDLSNNPGQGWRADPIYKSIIEEKGYNIWFYNPCERGWYGATVNQLLPLRNFCAASNERLYLENKGYYVEASLLPD